jgi:serine/threonine protein kinase/tetratricopeptide (TPR) repeat protein
MPAQDEFLPIIGQTLGHYRIIEKIGEGGMGVVYHAHDERLHRDVALKILLASLGAAEVPRERLLDEARIASALNHPHICTVYEVGEDNGRAYIVMEFVRGRPLSAVIPRDGLPAETVVRYGTQIAEALAHAHQHGIIHCDLKSSNVVMTSEGRAKVLDFGLAKRLLHKKSDAATQSHLAFEEDEAIAGTLPYLAPEVLRGEPARAQSDIWALGVMLYEMATGVRPFRGDTAFALSSAILRDPPAPLPRHILAGLRSIIQRCLTKEPAERYQGASETHAALQAIQPEVVIGSPALPRRRSGRAIDSLAVLPFENLTSDPETEYLSDGITETLIHRLAQLPRLRVMARSTMFRYKGQPIDPQAIGRDLHVRAVLTGRVFERGDALLIATELVDVADGSQLWGEQYNRQRADIFAVQDQIAKEISERLRIRLTGEDRKWLAKRHTEITEAYHLYLKGRYYWNKRTEEDIKKGIEYFNQAIEKDPSYALAHTGLADSYYLLASTAYGAFPSKEAFPRAKEAALKALQIDETLAEAHSSLAGVLTNEWDWLGAEKEYKRSIQLNPAYATAHHFYAFYLAALGRLEKALAEIKHAYKLDPLSLIINRDLGLIFYYARQPDRAIEQYQKTLELDPNFLLAHQALGRAYLVKGMHQEALAEIQEAAHLSGESAVMSAALAHAYAATGQTAAARKILADLLERSKQSFVSPSSIAVIYAGLGDTENALRWLEQAFEERSVGLLTLKVHPIFDGLHPDARFQDLLRRIGLAP